MVVIKPGRDTEGVVEDLHHRHEAVRRARGIGDDVVLSRVVGVFVDADHERGVDVGRRAEMMTFFAPALRCWPALSRVVNRPVDSMTTSTFSSPQGSSAGLRSASTLMVLDPTVMPSLVIATGTSRLPCVESYRKRWALTSGDVRSFTATTSMSGFDSDARKTLDRCVRTH